MPAACASAVEPKTRSSPATVIVPLVDGVDAGERLDQRGLPGAVLAHDDVHLAGAQQEVDVVERQDARELDRDTAHLDERCDLCVGRHVLGDPCLGRDGPPERGVSAPADQHSTSGDW